ncbi:MAG: DUF86 domain-containing protein [Clostridiales bacterium]|jgi:uncharacterized protein with HEPN domain|nr:DUF86 domain-containing protein [Clostridiales bacterium]
MMDDVLDILRFVEEINNFDDFIANKLYHKAIVMSILNIGELVKHLPPEFKATHDTIDWKRIAGMRNYMAHEYNMINNDMLWETVMNSIPKLADFLQEQLK